MKAALAPLSEALRSNAPVETELKAGGGILTPDGTLDLSRTKLTADVVQSVVESLRKNAFVTRLSFGTGQRQALPDECVFFLTTLLRESTTLQSLTFDASLWSTASVEKLIDALFENRSLAHLNLQCRVTSDQRRRIRSLLERNTRKDLPALPAPVVTPTAVSPEDLATCVRVLQTLSKEPGRFFQHERELNPVRAEANRLVEAVRRESDTRRQHRSAQSSESAKAKRKTHDEKVVGSTVLRQLRQDDVPLLLTAAVSAPPPSVPMLLKPRHCYICKAAYHQVHAYYDSLCPPCAELNAAKRVQTADLKGRTALITGGRIKIGYEATLMLLRAGANVVMTTRFPVDSARRLSQEQDFSDWQDRLQIHGLDLRDVNAVERFAEELCQDLGRLDILINNAAQTVHRPPEYYRHLLDAEAKGADGLSPAQAQLLSRRAWHQGRAPIPSAALSQVRLTPEDHATEPSLFPLAVLDRHGQQRDLRAVNSWTLRVGQIATNEVLETHYVNAIAPFVLINRLLPLIERTPGRKFVVNVSAMEGKFEYDRKQETHPHTNMAKASLNMLTRTAASDLARRGIYMTSVDTGWVTNENPFPLTEAMRANLQFEPPLDEIDGAARVLDPIFSAGEEPLHGVFLKDYKPASW